MSYPSELPRFAKPAPDGSRSFYLAVGGANTIRVSVLFHVLQEYVSKTATDLASYSDTEQECLKAAAVILSAKVPSKLAPRHTDSQELIDISLRALLDGTSKAMPRSFETWFPFLARLAVQAVTAACSKASLNILTQELSAPSVTSEDSVDEILAELRYAIKCLIVQPGRPVESTRFIKDLRKAVRRCKRTSKKPTQDTVAEILGMEPRTIRARLKAYGVTWEAMLWACGWVNEERNSRAK